MNKLESILKSIWESIKSYSPFTLRTGEEADKNSFLRVLHFLNNYLQNEEIDEIAVIYSHPADLNTVDVIKKEMDISEVAFHEGDFIGIYIVKTFGNELFIFLKKIDIAYNSLLTAFQKVEKIPDFAVYYHLYYKNREFIPYKERKNKMDDDSQSEG